MMECTIATLIACFSWSGFFVDSGVGYQDRGESRLDTHTQSFTYPNGLVNTWTYDTVNVSPQNPYGRFGLGYQAEMRVGGTRVVFEAEAWHTSSLETTKDRGTNAIGFSAKIFPFARR